MMTHDMNQADSFLPFAVEALATRRGKKGVLAKRIAGLIDEHGLQMGLFVAFSETLVNEPEYLPVQVLSYVQDLMDKVCWSARRYLTVSRIPEEVYGCDPTARVREEMNVSCEIEHVPELVDADFKFLYGTVAIMLSTAPALVFELHYFNPAELVDGEWVYTRTADSFGDAEVQMQEVVEYLDQTKPVEALEEMRRLAAQAAA